MCPLSAVSLHFQTFAPLLYSEVGFPQKRRLPTHCSITDQGWQHRPLVDHPFSESLGLQYPPLSKLLRRWVLRDTSVKTANSGRGLDFAFSLLLCDCLTWIFLFTMCVRCAKCITQQVVLLILTFGQTGFTISCEVQHYQLRRISGWKLTVKLSKALGKLGWAKLYKCAWSTHHNPPIPTPIRSEYQNSFLESIPKINKAVLHHSKPNHTNPIHTIPYRFIPNHTIQNCTIANHSKSYNTKP